MGGSNFDSPSAFKDNDLTIRVGSLAADEKVVISSPMLIYFLVYVFKET